MGHIYVGSGHSDTDIEDVGWDALNVQRIAGQPDRVKPLTTKSLMMGKLGTEDYWEPKGLYKKMAVRATPYNSPMRRCPSLLVDSSLPVLEFYHVIGYVPVDAGARGVLLPTRLEALPISIPDPEDGDGSIDIRDASGTLLYHTGFSIDPAATTYASAIVPAFPSMRSIELYANGVLHDTLLKSDHAPTVTVLSPTPGQALTSTIGVEWIAVDDDGDTLYSSVDYSRDGGTSWLPLLMDAGTSTLRLPASAVPSAADVVIRVTATDGINSDSVVVPGLSLAGNHSPTVTLYAPESGDVFKESAEVVFVGDAFDLEDGKLPDPSLSWVLTGNGRTLTGAGRVFTVLTALQSGSFPSPLPLGDYITTLTATDSAGLTAVGSVAFEIVAR